MILANWDGVPPAQAGPLGLLVILLLAGTMVFLYRSMTKHIKRVPRSFDPPAEPPAVEEPDTLPEQR
jgi:hypothetical protein